MPAPPTPPVFTRLNPPFGFRSNVSEQSELEQYLLQLQENLAKYVDAQVVTVGGVAGTRGGS